MIKDVLSKIYIVENKDSYQLMDELDYNGLYMIIFLKASCLKYVKNLDKIINKNSLLLRLNLNDSNIAIACNQLSSGQEQNEKRKSQIIEVLNTTFKKYSSLKFKDYDFYFYFGDINIKLDKNIDKKIIKDLIEKEALKNNVDYNSLFEYDQFKIYQQQNSLIFEMDELPINFSPTYKYIIGKNDYNPKTVPSWSDRIFYKKDSKTVPLFYNKYPLNISEHQPIYGIYNIQTEIIDEEQKQKIINEILKEKKRDNNIN